VINLNAPFGLSVKTSVSMLVAALAINFLMAAAVGFWARSRGRPWFVFFWLSFFFSPIVAIVGLFAAGRGSRST
jgi:hypothetical protein